MSGREVWGGGANIDGGQFEKPKGCVGWGGRLREGSGSADLVFFGELPVCYVSKDFTQCNILAPQGGATKKQYLLLFLKREKKKKKKKDKIKKQDKKKKICCFVLYFLCILFNRLLLYSRFTR